MYAPLLIFDHTTSHIKSMEEDARHVESDLRELQEDAGLIDEVNTFGPP